MREFKTYGEASSYLDINGFSEFQGPMNTFELATAVSKFADAIRKDQDKITRHACAEIISDMDAYESIEYHIGGAVDRNDAHRLIMNTKAI